MDVIAMKAVSHVTVMALDSLISYFVEAGVDEAVKKWAQTLREMTDSKELQAVQSMHRDLQQGMSTLSASMLTLRLEQREGTATVLRKLVEVRDTQRRDEQLKYLKWATSAVEDIQGRKYEVGHTENMELLKKAVCNSEKAAMMAHGTILTKLQAFRVWIVTEYMKEATRSCSTAKRAVIFTLGRKILQDEDILRICESYFKSRLREDVATACPTLHDVVTQRSNSISAASPMSAASFAPSFRSDIKYEGSTPGSMRSLVSSREGEGGADIYNYSEEEVSATLKFLLEIMFSITMMPPLDQDVACQDVVTVIGAGMKVDNGGRDELLGGEFRLGPNAPETIFLAMGKYCACHPHEARLYPSVSAVALDVWEKGKERLAMDHFFETTGGHQWYHNEGWMDRNGELRNRFGIAVEDGHVTKIHLPENNLSGFLESDLADCDHLRELVLHNNNVIPVIPPELISLIAKSNMVVTGIGDGILETDSSGSRYGLGTVLVARRRCLNRLPETPSVGTTSRNKAKKRSFLKKTSSWMREMIAADMSGGLVPR